MTRQDDYFEDMDRADEFGAAAGRPGGPNAETAAVTRFLGELSSLAEVDAPSPTGELEAILAGIPTRAARRRVLRRRLAVRAALIAAATVAGLIAAAANHTLPAPAQRVVSNVVNTVTPFHIDTGTGKPPASSPPTGPGHAREHEPRERSDDGLGAPATDGAPSSERSGDGEDSAPSARHGRTGAAAGEDDGAETADGGANTRVEAPSPAAQPVRGVSDDPHTGTRSASGAQHERNRDG